MNVLLLFRQREPVVRRRAVLALVMALLIGLGSACSSPRSLGTTASSLSGSSTTSPATTAPRTPSPPLAAAPVFAPITKATACQANNVRATELGAAGSGDALVIGVELQNLGRSTCRVSDGIEDVGLLHGTRPIKTEFLGLPVQTVPIQRLPVLRVPPGAVVAETLTWSNWCSSTPGPLAVRLVLLDTGAMTAQSTSVPPATLVPGAVGPPANEPVVPTCENKASPTTVAAALLETPLPSANRFAGDASSACSASDLRASYSFNQGSGMMLYFDAVVDKTTAHSCEFADPFTMVARNSGGTLIGRMSYPRSQESSPTVPGNGVPLPPAQQLHMVFKIGEPGISCPAGAVALSLSLILSDGSTLPMSNSNPARPVFGSSQCSPNVVQIVGTKEDTGAPPLDLF